MKATMEMDIDTTWANKVKLRVAAELDNPHTSATGELAGLMVDALELMVGEVRRRTDKEETMRREHDVPPELRRATGDDKLRTAPE